MNFISNIQTLSSLNYFNDPKKSAFEATCAQLGLIRATENEIINLKNNAKYVTGHAVCGSVLRWDSLFIGEMSGLE